MRRIAAFFLTICLCLTFVTGVCAAEYPFGDYGEIENRNAVTLLVDLGLISGWNDGDFHPGDSITRGETAKLLALLCTDQPENRSDVWFADIEEHWAADYIRFCAGEGVITGDGRGNFRPMDQVTGRELAKMLLVVVGNDPSRYSGRNWDKIVDQDAREQGIYTRFIKDPDQEVSRDDACLLIYNAIQSKAIEEVDRDGQVTYVMDELMNPITFLEARFGVVRYTGVLTGNQYAGLNGDKLEEGMTKVAGHKEFQVETDLSLLGACVDVYVRDGRVVGSPCISSDAVSYTFKDSGEMEELMALTGYETDPDTRYYLNYKASTADALKAKGDQVEITALDQNGDKVFEQISVVTYRAGLVEGKDPLTVSIDGTDFRAVPIKTGDRFRKDQDVLCVQVNGTWYVK